ncbi:MAG: phage tail sheath subtilisin-like domain-containing protein [Anaerolineae bacterium]|nr:phage tail sheath subtilisin-like domain-containing protein [Anaerolineae bacterium]
MGILDTPPGLNPQQVKAWRMETTGFDSSYDAMYYPWIEVMHPVTNQPAHIPPSEHIAGIWARNDNTRGVHKAPASSVMRRTLSGDIVPPTASAWACAARANEAACSPSSTATRAAPSTPAIRSQTQHRIEGEKPSGRTRSDRRSRCVQSGYGLPDLPPICPAVPSPSSLHRTLGSRADGLPPHGDAD